MWDAEYLSNVINRRLWNIEWEPRAKQAFLTTAPGRRIALTVTYVLPRVPVPPPDADAGSAVDSGAAGASEVTDKPPKVGDVRLLKMLRKLNTKAQYRGDCVDQPFLTSLPIPEEAQAHRDIWREYIVLEDKGDVEGPEFFAVVERIYHYAVRGCGAGFLSPTDYNWTWAHQAKAWPLP